MPASRWWHHDPGGLLGWLDYYWDQKLLLRFSRGAESSAGPTG